MPVLSCFLCIHNHEKSLEETLESILSQTFTDFELLVYDNASSDGSLKLLEKFAKKDARISLFTKEEKIHESLIFNELLQKMSGKFFAMHGSKDLSLPNRFALQLERLKNSSLVGVGSSMNIDFSPQGQGIQELLFLNSPKKVIEQQVLIPTHRGLYTFAAMYSKKIKTKKIFFQESMQSLYDLMFDIEIQNAFPLRLSNIKEKLYTKRIYEPEDLSDLGKLPEPLDHYIKVRLHYTYEYFARASALFSGYQCL